MSYYFLDGSVKDELDFDLREMFPENCGVFFGFDIDDAAFNCIRSLRALEPRGEKGAGAISLHHNQFYSRRRVGKVSLEFLGYDKKRCRQEFPGRIVLGHNRYATMGGANKTSNVQPFLLEIKCGECAMAHNGTLYEAQAMREKLLKRGAVFSTNSDTEIFYHLMAQSGENDVEKAIRYALKRVPAAYSLIAVFKEKSFVIKDYRATRPLALAKLGKGYIACSETFAIDQIPGAEYWREVNPGEMLVFEKDQVPRSVQYAKPDPHSCVFEPIYFMRPRSRINGCYVEDYRYAVGLAMADDIRDEVKERGFDCVIPILDSGEYFAKGLAYGLNLEYLEALARTKNFSDNVQDRSFTALNNKESDRIIRGKHNLRRDQVKGRSPIMADDSIVRGNTLRRIARWVREAKAKLIGAAVSFPAITNPCHGGMAFPTNQELMAHARTISQIRQRLALDSLFYLSVPTLNRVTAEKLNIGICDDCYRCKNRCQK
ncbi:MAG: phosphoribosyltransferase family protein [Patescibacteria group bacterium]|nr:phosphoribosyltransferase family protein [Patescibacteria group bacterium]